jgi:hypothetical protein
MVREVCAVKFIVRSVEICLFLVTKQVVKQLAKKMLQKNPPLKRACGLSKVQYLLLILIKTKRVDLFLFTTRVRRWR